MASSKPASSLRTIAFAILGALSAAPLTVLILRPVGAPVEKQPVSVVRDDELRRQAWARITPHLSAAERERAELAIHCTAQVAAFVEQRKSGAARFAEEALSVKSKWILAKSHMPWGEPDEHRRFIAGEFEKWVISEQALRQVLTSTLTEYTAGLQEIDNRLLVRIRADLSTLPTSLIQSVVDATASQANFASLLAKSAGRVSREVQHDAAVFGGSIAATVLVERIVTSLLSRLAVSGGVMAVGAGSSWLTFGIGFAVALGVDQVIAWATDPTGKITADVCQQLEALKHGICYGNAKAPALNEQLAGLAKARSTLVRKALEGLVLSQR